jgi:hypothetical protein
MTTRVIQVFDQKSPGRRTKPSTGSCQRRNEPNSGVGVGRLRSPTTDPSRKRNEPNSPWWRDPTGQPISPEPVPIFFRKSFYCQEFCVLPCSLDWPRIGPRAPERSQSRLRDKPISRARTNAFQVGWRNGPTVRDGTNPIVVGFDLRPITERTHRAQASPRSLRQA